MQAAIARRPGRAGQRIALATALILACLVPAEARPDAAERCHRALGDALQHVTARSAGEAPCSEAIISGRYTGRALARLYAKRGYIRQINWQPQAALRDYDRALRLDPQDDLTHYNRGIIHYREGRYQAAVADYSRAIALDPRQADYYHNRAFTHLWRLDLIAALADFWQAVLVSPFARWLLAAFGAG